MLLCLGCDDDDLYCNKMKLELLFVEVKIEF